MKPLENDLLRAVELAEAGDWDAAHGIAQRHEGDAVADWIHAVLHKIGGDAPNSRYWYARAGKPEWFKSEPEAEWSGIRARLNGSSGDP